MARCRRTGGFFGGHRLLYRPAERRGVGRVPRSRTVGFPPFSGVLRHRRLLRQVQQAAAGLATDRLAEHDHVAGVQRESVGCSRRNIGSRSPPGRLPLLPHDAIVKVADIARQGRFRLPQLDFEPSDIGPSAKAGPWPLRRGPPRFSAWRPPSPLPPRRPSSASRRSSPRFENFVGQHAVGHFVGGDLFEQELVFAVARGGVQLASQILDLVFAHLQLKLLLSASTRSALASALTFVS